MPLGDTGFLSVSAEKSKSASTYRGSQYCGSWFCLDPNGAAYDSFGEWPRGQKKLWLDPDFIELAKWASYDGGGPNQIVQPWGNPNHEGTRLFFNAGINQLTLLNSGAFGNYSDSEGDGSFFYRYPYNGTPRSSENRMARSLPPRKFSPVDSRRRFFSDITTSQSSLGSSPLPMQALAMTLALGLVTAQWNIR